MTEQHPGPYDGRPFDPYSTGRAEPAPSSPPEPAPAGDGDGFWQRQQPAAAPPAPTPPAPAEPAPPTSASSAAGNSGGDEDFDAWWSEHLNEQPKVTFYGERYPIPADVPLWITQLAEKGDADLNTLRKMIDGLYGQGVTDRWVEKGAGTQRLGVIIAWSMLRAQGEPVSFGQAVAKAEELGRLAEEQQAKNKAANDRLAAAAAGYAPDSPEARAAADAIAARTEAGKAPSFGTGAPSSPTSGVSTTSPA